MFRLLLVFIYSVRNTQNSCRVASHPLSPAARTPTRTLRLAGRILNAINRSDNSNTGSMGTVNGGEDDGSSHAPSVREAVDELVHHNDDRPPEQKEKYMLMANFVAHLCLAGCGDSKKGSALLWPSAQGRGLPGLVDAAYAVLGKLSCNVSYL